MLRVCISQYIKYITNNKYFCANMSTASHSSACHGVYGTGSRCKQRSVGSPTARLSAPVRFASDRHTRLLPSVHIYTSSINIIIYAVCTSVKGISERFLISCRRKVIGQFILFSLKRKVSIIVINILVSAAA